MGSRQSALYYYIAYVNPSSLTKNEAGPWRDLSFLIRVLKYKYISKTELYFQKFIHDEEWFSKEAAMLAVRSN